jgi:protein dithiol oxidoreductase (disulfide-forming)
MRLGISFLALAFLAMSTSQAGIIAGHDYVVLSTPQRQDVNGKIEVMEFFSWACPHCYEFYPKLARWLSTLPKDTSFRRFGASGMGGAGEGFLRLAGDG